MITKSGLDDTTIVTVTNTTDYSEITSISKGKITEGVSLLTIK